VPPKVVMAVVPLLEEEVVGNGIDKDKSRYSQIMCSTRTQCSCEVEYTE
jgi:hypothetical protein